MATRKQATQPVDNVITQLEQQLADAYARIMELDAALSDALARLDTARSVYREQRAEIATLRAQPKAVVPTRHEYTKRDGTRWVATRCGNRTTHTLVQ